MVKIRLQPVGRKKVKTYRIVVVDSRARRDGKAIVDLGFYNPITNKAHVKFRRAEWWRRVQGAQCTPTVRAILSWSKSDR